MALENITMISQAQIAVFLSGILIIFLMFLTHIFTKRKNSKIVNAVFVGIFTLIIITILLPL